MFPPSHFISHVSFWHGILYVKIGLYTIHPYFLCIAYLNTPSKVEIYCDGLGLLRDKQTWNVKKTQNCVVH